MDLVKTKPVAISKSQQKRIAIQSEPRGKKDEKPPKNPRVPIFPPHVVPLVNHLNEIIDKELNGDQDRRALAYGILSRLCVVWAPPIMREKFTVEAELVSYEETDLANARCRLSSNNAPIINELLGLMEKMFPNGEGLPEQVMACPL